MPDDAERDERFVRFEETNKRLGETLGDVKSDVKEIKSDIKTINSGIQKLTIKFTEIIGEIAGRVLGVEKGVRRNSILVMFMLAAVVGGELFSASKINDLTKEIGKVNVGLTKEIGKVNVELFKDIRKVSGLIEKNAQQIAHLRGITGVNAKPVEFVEQSVFFHKGNLIGNEGELRFLCGVLGDLDPSKLRSMSAYFEGPKPEQLANMVIQLRARLSTDGKTCEITMIVPHDDVKTILTFLKDGNKIPGKLRFGLLSG